MNNILSKIPAWLGFLLMIIVGIAMVINGLANPFGAAISHPDKVGFIIFGLCSLVIGIFSWVVGGTSRITGRTGIGYRVAISDLPWWGWLVDAIVLVISLILFFVLK